MLTWKIFVIIMFVTPITLVNVNSSGNRPPDTPRFRRVGGTSSSRSINLNNPVTPRGRTPSESDELYLNVREIVIYDSDQNEIFPLMCNTYNPLSETRYGERCYRQIRVFCDTSPNQSESNDCIKRAILYYKNNLQFQIGPYSFESIISAVKKFFKNFPFHTENMPLPYHFCYDKATQWMQNRPDINVMIQYPEEMNNQISLYADYCHEKLQDYERLIPNIFGMNQENMAIAVHEARQIIVRYTLLAKTTLGMQLETSIYITEWATQNAPEGRQPIVTEWTAENFEIAYLTIISRTITSADARYNPLAYCTQFNNEMLARERRGHRV